MNEEIKQKYIKSLEEMAKAETEYVLDLTEDIFKRYVRMLAEGNFRETSGGYSIAYQNKSLSYKCKKDKLEIEYTESGQFGNKMLMRVFLMTTPNDKYIKTNTPCYMSSIITPSPFKEPLRQLCERYFPDYEVDMLD